MATRSKMTPIGRLILFLIIIIPAAYAGAAYINGEDPVANFKNLINGETTTAPAAVEQPTPTSANSSAMDRLQTENADLRKRVQELEETIKKMEAATTNGANREPWGEQSGN